MSTQQERLQEVTIRMPLSFVEDCGFEALVSVWKAHRDELRLLTLSCCGSRGTLLVETSRPLESTAITEIEYVDGLQLVGHGPDRFEYLLETRVPRGRDALDECEGAFFIRDGVRLSEASIEFTIVAAPEAFRLFGSGDGASKEYEVLRVTEYVGERGPLDSLTERQRTALETAYAKGYYEVPRAVSSDELAAALDVEPSTVLEHLRRAERNILSELLGPKDDQVRPAQPDPRSTTVRRERTRPTSEDSPGRTALQRERT